MADKSLMSLPEDLLEQARFLARREPVGKPKQASLRRAVATAYYAVFHLLAADAAAQACPARPPGLRLRAQRALEHTAMKTVASSFASNNLPEPVKEVIKLPLDPRLISIASSFVRLQQERHNADYDLTDHFDRTRVFGLIRDAEKVFTDWNGVLNTNNARIFLASLFFNKNWNKK